MWRSLASLTFLAVLCTSAAAQSAGAKYTLRYKFVPGDVLRWQVVHQGRIRTTVSGTTQTAETVSQSVKVWHVTAVKPDGSATFEHSVEKVDMRQRLTGRDEVRYNSETDEKAPLGFETVAQSIGVPLSIVTVSARGEVTHRKQTEKAMVQNQGQITVPMPAQAIAVGQSWSIPAPIEVPSPGGTIKRINAVQKFTLTEVKTGIATIKAATQILTPIHDPAIEAQIIQSQSDGVIRFDIEAGRIVSQQMDVDKGVVGFRGEASSIHCVSRFTEELIKDAAQTAARTGPARSR
jgi:hypothetical protein